MPGGDCICGGRREQVTLRSVVGLKKVVVRYSLEGFRTLIFAMKGILKEQWHEYKKRVRSFVGRSEGGN